MLETLDAIIATAAVVLGLSLVVQAIQQIIKQVGSFKSSYMERELMALFGELKEKTIWSKLIPTWIQYRVKRKTKSDAKDLIDAIETKVAGLGYNDLSLIEAMKKEDFTKLVSSIVPDAAKLEVWKKDIKDWYDLTMKAFQDHYERRMKAWSYALSLLVVLWMNANIFDIYKEFSTNKVLRESAIKMAERLTAIPRDSLVVVEPKAKKASVRIVADSLALQSIQRHIAQIDSLVSDKSFHLMRWNTVGGNPICFEDKSGLRLDSAWTGLKKAAGKNTFGWLAMTFLVGLGAPFWYDFLKTVMGIKNAVGAKAVQAKSNDQQDEAAPRVASAGSKKRKG